jgi:methylmalonyl-CoA mutase
LKLLGVTGDLVLPLDVYNDIKARTLSQVRGTVQADILKEDQAQNTCIFSTEFALRLMGDVQEYFIKKNVRNFIRFQYQGIILLRQEQIQLHNWLSHFQTGSLMEYYLSRGMSINDFGPNLSFFFLE